MPKRTPNDLNGEKTSQKPWRLLSLGSLKLKIDVKMTQKDTKGRKIQKVGSKKVWINIYLEHIFPVSFWKIPGMQNQLYEYGVEKIWPLIKRENKNKTNQPTKKQKIIVST